MKHTAFAIVAVLALGACASQNAGRSGDFSQFEMDRANQGAAINRPMSQGLPIPVGAPGGPMNTANQGGFGAPAGGGIATSDLAAAGIGGAGTGAGNFQPSSGPVADTGFNSPMATGMNSANAAAAAPVNIASSGISDEQNFDAVTGRETIESDAQRRAAQAAAYQVIQPTALPERQGTVGPNLVDYALNAPNRRGQEWYSRFAFSSERRFQNNCAAYRSPDDAQRDFLARGGPERDPRGIDPDGDGFACGWDPAPFIAAARAN